MAANERLDQLSTTDASNTPAGSDVIGSSLDDELRSIKANIARSGREESTATASAAATLAVTVLNKIVPVSGSAAGSTTITLPAAATAGAGFRFTAWKTDNTNNVVIDANGAETINGGADYTMATQYEAAQFVTDGTSWVVESTAKREIGTPDLADDSVTLAKMEHGTSGDVLYYGASGAPTRLAKGTDGQVLGLASGIPAWQEEAVRTPYGFYTTVNATDPTNDIDISAGACWDTTRTVWIEGSAMTKQIDANWAAGTNAGFLDTGSVASYTPYHIFVMINDVDGSVDYITSLSNNWAGVTKPTNYTKGQLIGFVPRSTGFISVVWSGNTCYIDGNPPNFVTDSSMTTNTMEGEHRYYARDNSVAQITCFGNVSSGSSPDQDVFLGYTDGSPGTVSSGNIATGIDFSAGSQWTQQTQGVADVLLNNSGQLRAAMKFSTGTATLYLYLRSFTMPYRLEATS